MKNLLPILAFSILPVSAQNVNTDDAHQLARQFFTTHAPRGAHHAPARVEPVLAYTATTDGTPDLYVFNRADDAPGFVIINARDDAADTPILGYSDAATFDYDAAPANLRWWLAEYQRNGVAKLPAKVVAGRHDVDPIVATTWGQDTPYNRLVPNLGPRYKPFVTGCTATAMAQIMKVHNYPANGRGSHAYTINYSTSSAVIPVTFEADFSSANYDWANMLDDYSGSYTDAQADAVALLMYHAGVAEEATYGAETSADDRDSGTALINNFRYSPAMLRGERNYFTDEEWDNTLYAELAAGRPVMYSGSTTAKEGHAFVCDGYQAATGLYHFNWGWDSTSDGFFALTGPDALRPGSQGTGGAASGLGFTEHQSINYNILPTEAGSAPIQAAVDGHFTVGTDQLVRNTFTSRTFDRSQGEDANVYFRLSTYNCGFLPISVKSGVLLRHTTTGISYGQIGFNSPLDLPASSSQEQFYTVSAQNNTPTEYAHFSTTTAPFNGTYEVIPACTADDGLTWHPLRTLVGDVLPTITITGAEDPVAVELPFTLSASVVEVGHTVTVTPHPAFTGAVSYVSSDPAVATVSADGVVTALQEGHVTITATSEATTAFLATTAEFDIEVVSHIMRDVEVSLPKTQFLVGETARISLTDGYDGDVTYTVAPEGIVSVAEAGAAGGGLIVTALAEGDATITVHVAGNADFRPTQQVFNVSVTSTPPNTGSFEFAEFPSVGQDNIVTSDSEFILTLPMVNNASEGLGGVSLYYIFSFNDDYYALVDGIAYASIPAGYKVTHTFDLSYLLPYMNPGEPYAIWFFTDNTYSTPANVPYLIFYYAPDDPKMTDLVNLIDEAKADQVVSSKLIRSFANKLLGK